MKKILLLYNKKEREYKSLQFIKKRIDVSNSFSAIIIPRSPTKGFIKNVIKHKPFSVLTFPFTSRDSSLIFYILKFLYGFKLVTLRTEGIVDYEGERNIRWHTGLEKYGQKLVDYDIFWGRKQMKTVGKHLIESKKISSENRLVYVGNPNFEFPEKFSNVKKNTLLFATGFFISNYTKNDLIKAMDIPFEDFSYVLEVAKKAKKFKENLKKIIEEVSRNINYDIIVKIHPTEKESDYIFKNKKIKVYKNKDIHSLVDSCNYFFHYGSTTVLNSYILKKPAFFFYQNNLLDYFPDMGMPNLENIEINNLKDFLESKKFESFRFKKTKKIESVLKDQINYSYGEPYRPSLGIAKILKSNNSIQRINVLNYFLIRSFIKLLFKIKI